MSKTLSKSPGEFVDSFLIFKWRVRFLVNCYTLKFTFVRINSFMLLDPDRFILIWVQRGKFKFSFSSKMSDFEKTWQSFTFDRYLGIKLYDLIDFNVQERNSTTKWAVLCNTNKACSFFACFPPFYHSSASFLCFLGSLSQTRPLVLYH